MTRTGSVVAAATLASALLVPAAAGGVGGGEAGSSAVGAAAERDDAGLPALDGQQARAQARVAGPGPASDPDARERSAPARLRALRVEEPVTVDGRLREEAWQRAEAADDFRQRDPRLGEPATERTEARVLYDDRFLYLGFRLHDREPRRLIASDQRRDSSLETDDTVAVVLDTFHDGRNAYLFRTNPLGAKYDAIVKNERELNEDWDEKWEAAATIGEDGWEAELAIPWKSIRFPAGDHAWGIDFQRQIRRKNEDVYWSNYSRDFDFIQVSQAGDLVGLESIRLADRFRFKPFATAGLVDRGRTESPGTDILSEVGVDDFKIQLRPDLVLDLTANTDFAQVEVDEAQVNLTRFSLFFPEKREFFLEGRDNFLFGATGNLFGAPGPPLAQLFFSRRIGISEDGEPVPIRAGAKLTGTLGDLTIGALDVQTGATGETPANNFGVVRLQQNLLQRSRVGMLFTSRAGGGTHNRVVGADSEFFLHEHLAVGGFVARSSDSELGDDWTGQARGYWNSDEFTAYADVLRVGADLDSDLGFILRKDIVRQYYRGEWAPRPGISWLRQIRVAPNLEYIVDGSGRLESREQSVFVNFALQSGDSFFFDVNDYFERLDRPFRIHPDVAIPPGGYDFREFRAGFRFFSGRSVFGNVELLAGEFYDGHREEIAVTPQTRIGTSVRASLSYRYNRIRLPRGSFATHQANARVAYSFDERWLTDALIQYASTDGTVVLFGRLDYIYRTGDDLFIVYRQSRALDGPFEGRSDHRIAIKLTYSFEF